MGLTSYTVNEEPVQANSLRKRSGGGPNERKSECRHTVRKTLLVQNLTFFCVTESSFALLCMQESISKRPQSSQRKSAEQNERETAGFCSKKKRLKVCL